MKTFVALCSIAMLAGACQLGFNSVEGSGNIVTENRNVEDFTIVHAAGPMDVEITMGNEYKVEVEADDNLMSYIIVKKEGDKLIVRLKNNVNVNYNDGMKVRVEMPSLKAVEASGSGSVKTTGQVTNNEEIRISVSGSGDVVMDVKSPRVETSTAGSGKTVITGQTKKLDVSIAGSGDVDAHDLKSESAEVSIAGSGTVKLFASIDLDVSIAGSGDVIYFGSPNIKKSVMGSGDVRQGQ